MTHTHLGIPDDFHMVVRHTIRRIYFFIAQKLSMNTDANE